MQPIVPSTVRAPTVSAHFLPRAPVHWMVAADDIATFILLASFVWALVLVVLWVLP